MRSIPFGCSILAVCIALCGTANAQATNARAIYRCESGGALTFSDRPCDARSEVHTLDSKALNTFAPPPGGPASRSAAKPKSRKKSSGRAADRDKHEEKCERLAQGLKDVRAKQRSGYKASEGERLRDRERKLKSQLREARCG